MPRKSSDQLTDNLHDVMMEMLPSLVKEKVTEQVKKEVPATWAYAGTYTSQIQNAIDTAIPSLVDASVRSYMSGHILHLYPAQVQSSSVSEQQHQLYLAMKADPLLQQQDIAIWTILMMMLILRGNSGKKQEDIKYEANLSECLIWDNNVENQVLLLQYPNISWKRFYEVIDESKLKEDGDEMLGLKVLLERNINITLDQHDNCLQSDSFLGKQKEILVSRSPHQ
ncbi:hypothetical protein Tco_1448359 [Tanacetum coccineum]